VKEVNFNLIIYLGAGGNINLRQQC